MQKKTKKTTARTRVVLLSLGLILAATYLALALATWRPLAALFGELLGVIALWALYAVRFRSDDPRALAPEILWFRLKDGLRPPPRGAIVFVGSSTIAHWWSLVDDMAPLPVVNRGINGARLRQLPDYVDRIVTPYAPRAVVVYAGENDIAGFLGSTKRTPDEVLASFQALCAKVHARLPTIPIYFISIKPPKRRTSYAVGFCAANRLVEELCRSDERLHFIDAERALIDAAGEPRAGIFEADGIHLNDAGYRILTSIVKPLLERAGPAVSP
jgi:lysophospholipase L1-like esterase